MVEADVEYGLRAPRQYLEDEVRTADLCRVFGISERTLRGWCRRYQEEGAEGLRYRSRRPERSPNRTPTQVEDRILRMRRTHRTWGAKRIHAYLARSGVTIHWRTVHRVLQRNSLRVRVRRKPKPSRGFQRQHVVSLRQFDVFEFGIAGVGRVYVFNLLGDRPRYLVMSKAFRRRRAREATNALWWAHPNGRRPKAAYVDNGTCFLAREFWRFCEEQAIQVIYRRPYNPRGLGKLESFHKVLCRELVAQIRFRSLSHFRQELWWFRRRYSWDHLHDGIAWRTPAEVYND